MAAKRRCHKCQCPLIRLLLDNKQYEGRVLCARCKEEKPVSKKPDAERSRKRREAIYAWRKANQDKARQHAREYAQRNKDEIARKRTLLIEDMNYVRAISKQYYADREQRAKERAANERANAKRD